MSPAESPPRRRRCPSCGASLPASSSLPVRPRHWPFCSPRCQLIDLGRWLDEDYRISRPLGPNEHA